MLEPSVALIIKMDGRFRFLIEECGKNDADRLQLHCIPNHDLISVAAIGSSFVPPQFVGLYPEYRERALEMLVAVVQAKGSRRLEYICANPHRGGSVS